MLPYINVPYIPTDIMNLIMVNRKYLLISLKFIKIYLNIKKNH
jgi:hypothetical protein